MTQSKNIGRDIGQGPKSLVGGELVTYIKMVDESRTIAIKRMMGDTKKMGANTVVAPRYGTSAIAVGTAKVFAYGTTVRFV